MNDGKVHGLYRRTTFVGFYCANLGPFLGSREQKTSIKHRKGEMYDV